MIKVRDQGNMYKFLFEVYNSKLDDIRNGWIYLNCDLDYFNNTIMRTKRYYDKKKAEGF